jgi:hypothetical protein
MTGRKVDRVAVERAVEAWKIRRDEQRQPVGFSDDEATALAGIDVPTLEELVPRLQVWPSFRYDDAFGWWVDDLVRLVIAVELYHLGLPPLVLACVCSSFPDDEYGQQWVRELADRPTDEVVYPLTNAVGERWLTESGLVYRHLWSADDLARMEEDDDDLYIDNAARDADARACIASGEAVAYRKGATALRVLRAVEALKEHGGRRWIGAT